MFYIRISILFAFVMYLLTFAVRNNITVLTINLPPFGYFQNVHILIIVLISIFSGMTLHYLISLFNGGKKKKK
jgi:hypothetical protein